ncbi:hypothetical protein KC19_10G136200 [Ceratodon purpureus]|uniref:Protein kinase domain-containing protein n=1 Tax=Ceratodon purpureus TaxID=3225 RepID=A0A8T0GQA0_CERPU|nr:hypothetical protein KC19_10G136200 [Ceratodon purpureus]
MGQAVSQCTSTISEYHTGESFGNHAANSRVPTRSSSSSSKRIKSMIKNRSNFSSEAEFNIEFSEIHWSELTDSDTDDASTRLTNREYFQVLTNHPEWGGFFKDINVVLGEKISEGGQAEIYDAKVEFADGREFDYGYYVVKLMKGDNPLQVFQRQWPVGMLRNVPIDNSKGPLMYIKGGTMIDDRFGFVMVRQWGDLRKLIDLKMQLNNNQDLPFKIDFVKKVMKCIARDMEKLHNEYGIVHRDLKASNILLWSFGDGLPDENPDVKATVVDYECSVGVVGTGLWRAPEILQQLKDGVKSSKLEFTKMADIFSFGMICYELLTGCMPFEGHDFQEYSWMLSYKPDMSTTETLRHYFMIEIMKCCWEHEPLYRPTFSDILGAIDKVESTGVVIDQSPISEWTNIVRNRIVRDLERQRWVIKKEQWARVQKGWGRKVRYWANERVNWAEEEARWVEHEEAENWAGEAAEWAREAEWAEGEGAEQEGECLEEVGLTKCEDEVECSQEYFRKETQEALIRRRAVLLRIRVELRKDREERSRVALMYLGPLSDQ